MVRPSNVNRRGLLATMTSIAFDPDFENRFSWSRHLGSADRISERTTQVRPWSRRHDLRLPGGAGHIVKETKEQGAIGVPIGLALGVGMLVARELVGVYEFVTAPFPVPAILRPEYPWDYFE
jgi:putative exosortase-associated protein (TIGR04073 family)